MNLRQNIAEGKLNSKLKKFLYAFLIIACLILLAAAVLQKNLTPNMRIIIITIIPLFFVIATIAIEIYIYFLQKIANRINLS